MTRLHKRLYRTRKYIGKGQRDMAKGLGVGLNTWIRWEKGETIPGMEIAEHLLNMLPELNPEWLLTGKHGMLRTGDDDQRIPGILNRLDRLEGYDQN